jgi:hypothetical protein
MKGKRSWWLADAQKLAGDYSDTFHKPSSEVVQVLMPEDEVKLIFRFDSDDPETQNAKRMWVEITKIGVASLKEYLITTRVLPRYHGRLS